VHSLHGVREISAQARLRLQRVTRAIHLRKDHSMHCPVELLREPHVFVGIRRHGVWMVKPAAQLQEADLTNIDLLRDFQSASTAHDDLSVAEHRVAMQAATNVNPFQALIARERQRSDLTRAIDYVCSAVSKMLPQR
jgi:hypothetical protein